MEKSLNISQNAVDVFCERLTALMKNNKITKKAMALGIGITPCMLGYYFNNTTIRGNPAKSTWEITCKIIDYLRLKVGENFEYDYLFGIEYSKDLMAENRSLLFTIKKLEEEKGKLIKQIDDLKNKNDELLIKNQEMRENNKTLKQDLLAIKNKLS